MPQQVQPGMMPQGGLQSHRGNNAYNNQSMFMLMRQFDANGNGQLDPNELQNMKLAIAQMRAGGPNWTTMQYLQRFDANGNGQLDPNEMQAAQAALTQGVQGGPNSRRRHPVAQRPVLAEEPLTAGRRFRVAFQFAGAQPFVALSRVASARASGAIVCGAPASHSCAAGSRPVINRAGELRVV